MSQHFLLSAKARTLSLAQVARMSDDEAYAAFRAVRWEGGRPVCPACGCDACYEFKSRRIFKCKACDDKQFSVTSGTIFHSRKLSMRDLLLAIAIFVNGVNGYAALQLSRDLSCDYKTAFVLAHKLREVMGTGRPQKLLAKGDKPAAAEKLTGVVEIDGAVFGGHYKKANFAEDRKDRRSTNPKQKAVITLRERRPGGRTYTFVGKHEADAFSTVIGYIDRSAHVRADEGSWWNPLRLAFKNLERINHSEAYSLGNGVHTNWVESFNGRLRRAEDVHRSISSDRYLPAYAQEIAWREDHRRVSNGVQFSLVARHAATLPEPSVMKGYWQRRGPRPTPPDRPPHIERELQATKALAVRRARTRGPGPREA